MQVKIEDLNHNINIFNISEKEKICSEISRILYSFCESLDFSQPGKKERTYKVCDNIAKGIPECLPTDNIIDSITIQIKKESDYYDEDLSILNENLIIDIIYILKDRTVFRITMLFLSSVLSLFSRNIEKSCYNNNGYLFKVRELLYFIIPKTYKFDTDKFSRFLNLKKLFYLFDHDNEFFLRNREYRFTYSFRVNNNDVLIYDIDSKEISHKLETQICSK